MCLAVLVQDYVISACLDWTSVFSQKSAERETKVT